MDKKDTNEMRELSLDEMDLVVGGLINENGGSAPPSMISAKENGWSFSQYVDVYMKYMTPAQLQIAYGIWSSI